MARPGPLNQWLGLQQRQKEEVENQVRAGAANLSSARNQLETLHNFRARHTMNPGNRMNGLQLNNTQHFHQQMDQVIQLQDQQVAIQESQQRRRDEQLKEAWMEVRKTEILLEKQMRKEQLIQNRKEQKMLDETAAIMLRRRLSEQG
ncbi:flagellar export protein FliJ [Parendozoicomonas haliclonae]|uniref:Flagellar FliJ protein n=1 Tax=Parendozoicomonas haliclonae TaxID=1960125 RepID=A0A1X7AND3_9GAMM|nr:flagellar export protein FliJ [Parendozoicomonas haliclonae]SMA49632.1 flagellar biosynthesis chaperone [Parendozoicomonas haliclonae]